ncbi:MAG: TolC family protein [Flavobacteriales bacterium]
MNLIKHLILVLSLSLVADLSAQKAWSLEECVNYAVEHNLQLGNTNNNALAAKESYRQSVRELLPTVSGNANYSIRYGRSIDPNTNVVVTNDFFSNSYSIDAALDIFQGFQKKNSIASNKFLSEAAKENAEQEKYLLAFNVMSAFYDVQFFKGLVEINKEQETISKNNLDLVNKQIEIGTQAVSDRYDAESILVSDQLEVTRAENQLKASELALAQIMNLEGKSRIDILDFTPNNLESIQASSEAIYKEALTFLPMIKSQELTLKSAEKEVSLARGGLAPSLVMFAGYGTGFFETNINQLGETINFNDQIENNASQYIGLSLNIPILSRWRNRSNISQQKIQALTAMNNLNIQKQELNNLIQQAVLDYDASKAELIQTELNEDARALSFLTAQKRFDKGLISAIELFQAKNLYSAAQNQNLQVKLRLEVQRKTLEFYQGLPVFNLQTTK